MPEPQTLLTGLAIGESPRWHEGRLWFCHWGAQEVIAVDLQGNSEVVAYATTNIGYSIDGCPTVACSSRGRKGFLCTASPTGRSPSTPTCVASRLTAGAR